MDMAQFAALKAVVQWANRMGVVRESRTRKGTLPVNRGVSAAAARGLRGHSASRVPGGTARLGGRSAPARRWRSQDQTAAWEGNDPVGKFRKHVLASRRLQLLELRVGRADGFGLLRRCRLSQASCDEEGDKDRLLELQGHYSDVEVGYDLPLLVEGWVQGDLLGVDETFPGL